MSATERTAAASSADPYDPPGLAASAADGPETDPAGPQPSVGLRRYAVLVVVVTFLLVKWGAMVTSTGAGMAYYDWPLANGSLWPADMRIDGFLEHGHRTVGALVGLLTIGLVVWTWRADGRRWVGKLTLGILGLVIVQGLLGGTTVLLELKSPVFSVMHGVLGQTTLCALTFLAFALSPSWRPRVRVPAAQAHGARVLCWLALVLIFAQLVAGAVVRHMELVGVLWLHVSMALVVSLAILVAASYCTGKLPQVPGFRSLGNWILGALGLQLLLGFVTLAVRTGKQLRGADEIATAEVLGRAIPITGHVVVGALLFLLATLLLARSYRNLDPA